MIEVTAAVIENAGRILICRRRKGGPNGGLWEFPGGKIEPGESAEEALRREIKEELDLDIEVGERLGAVFGGGPSGDLVLEGYRARLRRPGGCVLRDHDDVRWVVPEELAGFPFAPADRPFVELLRGRKRP